MTTCKSPAHKQYTNAVESFYIQAALAERDLAKRLAEAQTEAIDTNQTPYETFQPHFIDEAMERLQFARQQLADANVAINHHFSRGCSNVSAA